MNNNNNENNNNNNNTQFNAPIFERMSEEEQAKHLACPGCGERRPIRQSNTAKNPGRYFVVCQNECKNSYKFLDEIHTKAVDFGNKKRKQSDLTQSGFNVPKKYEGILKRENSSVDNKENIDPIAFTNLIKTMRDKQVLLDSLILKCEQEYERIMKGVNN